MAVAAHALHHAADGGEADALQALQQAVGELQFAVPGEAQGGGDQRRLQSLGTGVVQGASHQADSGFDLRPVGATPLAGAGLAGQVAVQPPDQGLAVATRDPLGFVREPAAFPAAGSAVVRLDQAQVVQTFRQGHLVVFGHGSLSVALSLEGPISFQ